jgi:hypothetical protein
MFADIPSDYEKVFLRAGKYLSRRGCKILIMLAEVDKSYL